MVYASQTSVIHLPVFNVRFKNMNEFHWRQLLFNEEIIYSKLVSSPLMNTSQPYELPSEPEQTQLSISRQGDFYILVALSACISCLLSLSGFIFAMSRQCPALIKALLYFIHWILPGLAQRQGHYAYFNQFGKGLRYSMYLMALTLHLFANQFANRIYWMPFLVVAAWIEHLQMTVEAVEDTLRWLPTAANRRRMDHVRAVAISILLAVLPLLLIYYLLLKFNFEIFSWLLLNYACCFFVSIEAARSILAYALMTYSKFVPIESLDQWLYTTSCTTGAIDMTIMIVKTIAFGLLDGFAD